MSKEVTTTEGNKLIAEFMGMRMEAADVWADKETGSIRILGEYRPHIDWNELMPVVEKMADFGCWNIRPNDVRLEDWSPEKRFSFRTTQMDWEREDGEPVEFAFLIWHIAVKGIQWYNQNKNS